MTELDSALDLVRRLHQHVGTDTCNAIVHLLEYHKLNHLYASQAGANIIDKQRERLMNADHLFKKRKVVDREMPEAEDEI